MTARRLFRRRHTPPAAPADATDPIAADEPAAARRAVALTLVAMWRDAILGAFWPLLSVLALGAAALALGLVGVLADGGVAVALAAWGAAVTLTAVRGAARFARPDRDAARARVDATLPGAPISALRDRLALGADDPGAAALWRAHRDQMRRAAAAARPVMPDAGLRRRDPFALRLAALTALAMAALFGGSAQIGQGVSAVAATWKPAPAGGPAATVPVGPGWEGWAAPPAYTRRPTIYLNALPAGGTVEVPEGTRFTFRLYGPDARLTQDVGPATGDDDAAPEFTAQGDGTIVVAGLTLPVRVVPDDAPRVAAGPVPDRRADGRLVQDFTAADDNGVESGWAEITLDLAAVDRRHGLAVAPEPRPALTLDLPLPGGAARRDVRGRLTADLSRHPWANLPVTMRLDVADGIGQAAQSAPVAMDLPGRRFFDPVAAALIEMRRDLLWSRDNAVRTGQLLRAIRWQSPDAVDGWDPDLTADLDAAIAVLDAGPLDDAARDALADALWQTAERVEDGGLNDALARMQRAQEKLSQAIRQGASQDEIDKLMAELKAATDAYTAMLADREADPADRFDRSPQQGQMITGDQIQQMMDEIERLMSEGRMAEAQELLDQFNRMMANLKVRQGQGGDGAGGGRSRPMQRLTDTLREQQDLADDAMRQAQDNPFGAAPDAETGDSRGGDAQTLAERQRALREELGRQRALLPGRGTPQGEDAGRRLDDAGRAMQDAERALRDGDPGAALERQADAIAALREGMRALGDLENAQRGATDRGAEDRDATADDGLTDPLGRSADGGHDDVTTGDSTADDRAGALQDEVRRRSAERSRPHAERDYLRRLLDLF